MIYIDMYQFVSFLYLSLCYFAFWQSLINEYDDDDDDDDDDDHDHDHDGLVYFVSFLIRTYCILMQVVVFVRYGDIIMKPRRHGHST